MDSKILILANSSSGLYSFRRELIGRLLENHPVVASTPDRGSIRSWKRWAVRSC